MDRISAPLEVHGSRHIADAAGIGPSVVATLGDFNWRYVKTKR